MLKGPEREDPTNFEGKGLQEKGVTKLRGLKILFPKKGKLKGLGNFWEEGFASKRGV